MSSNHHQLNCQNGSTMLVGEIEHTNFLSENIGSLYLNSDYSDIILSIDGQKIHAHKVILAARSEYFRALLFGGMKESLQDIVELKDTNADSFKTLLRYIYAGHMSLTNMKDELILEVLGLAHQFGFVGLEAAISDYLRQTLAIRTCCSVYDCARIYNLKFLMQVSAEFIDKHALEIIKEDFFFVLSADSIKELMSRDSFFAAEVDIFRALCRWMHANNGISQDTILDVLTVVRLPLMTLKELFTVVRPASVLSSDNILDAIELQALSGSQLNSKQRFRGLLRPDENMALPRHGTVVLQGEMRSALLDGDTHNYDLERGYTRHTISEPGSDTGILIKLGTQCIVNHIKILLWDKDLRSYSYYVEVSIDQRDWVRVVDHTRYYCRSWQYLYFEPRVVRFVRIVGTNNTVNKVFHVVCFEIMYALKVCAIENGLLAPKHNIATCSWSASVIEGVSRTRNALLDGNTVGYDWDSGYTCHQLGSGSILIQLGQPYLLDSMRLLLWDCDDRTYSYFVEVSINMWDWEVIVDKTKESCQSWQILHFEKRPIVFIRITGTHNSANEVFHCVHFECPAQVEENVLPTKSALAVTSSSTRDFKFEDPDLSKE